MPEARKAHELVLVDNCIYAIGGWTPTKDWTNEVEKFDVKSQMWTKAPSMLRTRIYFCAVSIIA